MLIAQSAEQVLRVSMELGGNAPFLVFEDADLDAAVDGALIAKLRNVGEACTAANRFHVHESIAAEFARADGRAHGGAEGRARHRAGVDIGPLIDERQRDIVAELVDDAVGQGRQPAHRRRALSGPAYPGYFFEPTVLADVPAGARILREEIFGPVAPVAYLLH